MATVTSTVGLGKTYATLAAWAAARSGILGSGDTEIAECYSGANLGGLSLEGNGGGWTAENTIITVAGGHRHNGQNVGTTGVAFCNSAVAINSIGGSVIVEYLRFQRALTLGSAADVVMDITVQKNMFAVPAASTSGGIFACFASTVDAIGIPEIDVLFVNNVVYYASNAGIPAMTFNTETDGVTAPSLDVVCVNNSAVAVSGSSLGYVYEFFFAFPTLDTEVICWNNVADTGATAATPFRYFNDSNSGVTISDQYNISSGPGATSFGEDGTGSVDDAGPIVVSTTNLNLYSGSPAQNAGTSAASVYGASPDAIGTVRPQGAAWDMGALELVQTMVRRVRRGIFRFWQH